MSTSTDLKLTIHPDDQRKFGPCECCGNMSSKVWGYVGSADAALAAYFVEWTQGHEDRAANFDLIVGSWGEGTSADDRQAVAIAFRHIASAPSFMVIDAQQRDFSKNKLIGISLTRNEVLSSPIRSMVFSIPDVIYVEDPRLSELR